jgi:hypothetical protein
MTSTVEASSKLALSLNNDNEQILPSTCSSSVSLSNSSMLFESNHYFDKLNMDMNKLNVADKENEAAVVQNVCGSGSSSSSSGRSQKHDALELAKLEELSASTSTKYGELIVLGYNGCIGSPDTNSAIVGANNSNMSRRRSKYVLKSRDKPNGVRPATQHTVQSSQEADVIYKKKILFYKLFINSYCKSVLV